MDQERSRLLKQACISALNCENQTGIPAALTVAQWALESGWGSHCPRNNCFGIKGTPATGQLLSTTEWFGAAMAGVWVSRVKGRTAVLLDGVAPDAAGRRKYACKDWFEVFDSLDSAFIRHAKIFTGDRYQQAMQRYEVDKDIEALVKAVGPIYATDPTYVEKLMQVITMDAVKEILTEYSH